VLEPPRDHNLKILWYDDYTDDLADDDGGEYDEYDDDIDDDDGYDDDDDDIDSDDYGYDCDDDDTSIIFFHRSIYLSAIDDNIENNKGESPCMVWCTIGTVSLTRRSAVVSCGLTGGLSSRS